MTKKKRAEGEDAVPMPQGADVEYLNDDLALLSFPLSGAEIPEALSAAEQEVALQVFTGASTKEIAHARGVSPRTVGNQLESIYRKLGVSSRAELVLRLGGRGREPG